jgi:hypothetical protein
MKKTSLTRALRLKLKMTKLKRRIALKDKP